ncbi:hypothetical protein O181_033780 [Austropuccinia psidii MF-1]|uniref:Reverse transcriptase/retrotransposon-derived protein RNase H-like domain-containing protein n=1 Tax=Austropuccinia psidii MF-1 TaxID=1389203 RepID=A0A9Q3H9J7_9BASI|nr:hypothetical protein [Austropuccinia psidii MF-1]
MLRKNSPAFAIGDEPLGKIKGHDIEICLDVERPYPPMLRRPPCPQCLATRKEIEKHINELLDMDKPHLRFCHISSSLYKVCSKEVVFEITKERRDAYERIKHELTNAPVIILPEFELPFKLYKDTACSQGLGADLHQRQIVDGDPREGLIGYISRQLKDPESRYGPPRLNVYT